MAGPRMTRLLLFLAAFGAVSQARAASRPPVPAGRYVHHICVAISIYEQRVAERSTRVTTPRRLHERKRVLRAFVRDLVRYTRTTAKSINQAGVPAVPDGAEAAAAVRTAFHDTLAGLQKALTAISRMPTSSERAFDNAGGKIAVQLADALANNVTALVGLADSPALDAAASHDRACANA